MIEKTVELRGIFKSLPTSEGVETAGLSKAGVVHLKFKSLPTSEGVETRTGTR